MLTAVQYKVEQTDTIWMDTNTAGQMHGQKAREQNLKPHDYRAVLHILISPQSPFIQEVSGICTFF